MRNLYILSVLLLSCASAYCDEAITNENVLSNKLIFGTLQPSLSYTFGAYKSVLTIKPNGDVVLGEGVTPDEASIQFWKQLKNYLPSVCEGSK